MKLGGNIEIEGFDDIEPAQLVVIKKMIGNSAKKISEEISTFDNLSVTLNENEKGQVMLSAKITMKDKEHEAGASDKNLFFALNNLFNNLIAKLK